MSQMDIFPADPPAQLAEHGGYHPASKQLYRGQQVPVTYQEQEGMRLSSKPTLLWLMDDILDGLYAGPVLRRSWGRELRQRWSRPRYPGMCICSWSWAL